MSADTAGPVIVWENYGTEGWHPKSYLTIKDALLAVRYNSEFVVTKRAEFDVVETDK
jgi:hypothetical protein